jgi:4-amino-4-deoxy-L-arabinose transferase-like glycosyltransferase
MCQRIKQEWPFIVIVLLLCLLYFSGIKSVPFHPDESTQIYMSKDLSILLSNPSSISYTRNQPMSPEVAYRALDAPITRYIIGLGRFIFNIPELQADWDWGSSWDENSESGALPSEDQLLIARISTTMLLPISLILFYSAIRVPVPRTAALIAVTFLGLHPLLLLHARRAMAESAVLLGISFFLWSLTRNNTQPWLVGIALAVAVNAKQTAVGLFPVGIIAVCLLPHENRNLKKMITRTGIVLIIFLIISLVLNPFFWNEPLYALKTSLELRQNLSQQQALDHLFGNQLTYIQRLFSGVLNLYFREPSAYEITSYLDGIRLPLKRYFENSLHSWSHGLAFGVILLALTFGGMYTALKSYPDYGKHQKKLVLLPLLATASLLITTVFIPLVPWQRYIIPLVPLVANWIGFSILPFLPERPKWKTTSNP